MSNDRYCTPDDIYRGIDAEFNFNIDVCTNETGSDSKCDEFITVTENALLCNWQHYCMLLPANTKAWVQPPYSKPNIPAFLKKCCEQMELGVTSVALVPAKAELYWSDYVIGKAAEVRNIIGRVQFLDPVTGKRPMRLNKKTGKMEQSGNNFHSSLIVYRPNYRGITHTTYITVQELIDRGSK